MLGSFVSSLRVSLYVCLVIGLSRAFDFLGYALSSCILGLFNKILTYPPKKTPSFHLDLIYPSATNMQVYPNLEDDSVTRNSKSISFTRIINVINRQATHRSLYKLSRHVICIHAHQSTSQYFVDHSDMFCV